MGKEFEELEELEVPVLVLVTLPVLLLVTVTAFTVTVGVIDWESPPPGSSSPGS